MRGSYKCQQATKVICWHIVVISSTHTHASASLLSLSFPPCLSFPSLPFSAALSFSFCPSLPLCFSSCPPLIMLFPAPSSLSLSFTLTRGGQPVDGKLISIRWIPYGHTACTDLFCVCVCVCAVSSRASATRRRKPPTWRPMSGGSTDCVTWWPLRSAWWVVKVDPPGACLCSR